MTAGVVTSSGGTASWEASLSPLPSVTTGVVTSTGGGISAGGATTAAGGRVVVVFFSFESMTLLA